MRSSLCRYLKRRRKSEWFGLLVGYAALGYLIFGAIAYAQAGGYRFGSGTFGTEPQRPMTPASIDSLQQSLASQGAQLEVMNERARYNVARLDELAAANLPTRMALLEKAAKDAADSAADLKRLGYQLLAAVIAGLVLQIIHVRSSRATSIDDIRAAVADLMRGKAES